MNEELAKALLAAQQEMPTLVRDSTNPDFETRYLSLGKLVEQVYPVLHKHGLFVIQSPATVGWKPALTTRIVCVKADAEIESTMLLQQAREDPQGQGSALTYARRYALMGMLGLVADEDDDGNSTRGAPVADHGFEFDPGKDRLPGAPRGDDLLKAVAEIQQAVDPTVDWKALAETVMQTRFNATRQTVNANQWEEFLLRWVNAVTRLRDEMSGDFPPLTDETITDAFKWAFGVDVTVPHLAGDA